MTDDLTRAREWLTERHLLLVNYPSDTLSDERHTADLAALLAAVRAEGRAEALREARSIAGRKATKGRGDDPCGRARRMEADDIAVEIEALAKKGGAP